MGSVLQRGEPGTHPPRSCGQSPRRPPAWAGVPVRERIAGAASEIRVRLTEESSSPAGRGPSSSRLGGGGGDPSRRHRLVRSRAAAGAPGSSAAERRSPSPAARGPRQRRSVPRHVLGRGHPSRHRSTEPSKARHFARAPSELIAAGASRRRWRIASPDEGLCGPDRAQGAWICPALQRLALEGAQLLQQVETALGNRAWQPLLHKCDQSAHHRIVDGSG